MSRIRVLKLLPNVSCYCFTDVLLGEVIPRILAHIRSFLQSNTDLIDADVFETNPGFLFWSKMMEAIKDPYAVERMSEQILHYLATEQASDTEAYWTLWMLFHQIFYRQKSVRYAYVAPTRAFFAYEIHVVL